MWIIIIFKFLKNYKLCFITLVLLILKDEHFFETLDFHVDIAYVVCKLNFGVQRAEDADAD